MTSSELEIGVWVEGVQKWVTGVTRRTTCHDVIKALLRAQSHGRAPEDCDVMQFVIVERWRKVERPLDHEQRILKVSSLAYIIMVLIVFCFHDVQIFWPTCVWCLLGLCIC